MFQEGCLPSPKGPAVRGRAVTASIALGALSWCAACSSPYVPPQHADPSHAIATVYVQKPLDRGFRLEGNFSLPRMPFNGGWYANWITYTAKPTALVPFPPFIQVGLIRTRERDFALQPFVAMLPHGKSVTLHTYDSISNGPHRLSLESKGGMLAFDVDGAEKYRTPGRDIVAPGVATAYLQIGHELSAQDDRAKGSIRALAFSYGSKTALAALDTHALACSFSSNGVVWKTAPAALIATGKFDAAVADVGTCTP